VALAAALLAPGPPPHGLASSPDPAPVHLHALEGTLLSAFGGDRWLVRAKGGGGSEEEEMGAGPLVFRLAVAACKCMCSN
jgi:hypothetical protein